MDPTWRESLGEKAPVLQSMQVGEDLLLQGARGIIRDETSYYIKQSERRDQEQQALLDNGTESDCPLEPIEQRIWIRRLFDAIKNTDGVIDKPCKNGAPAQSVQRIIDNYYSDEAIEIACWNTFIECRQAALGVRMVDPHHQTKREPQNAYPTFASRMEKIIQVCTTSKATCKQLLDPLFVHRLVDAPAKALQMKESNLRINGQRNIQNSIGREQIKKQGIQHPDLIPLRTPSKPKRASTKRTRKPKTPVDLDQGSTSLTPGFNELKTYSNKRRAENDGDTSPGPFDDSPSKRKASRKRVASISTPSKKSSGHSKVKLAREARTPSPKPAESSPNTATLLTGQENPFDNPGEIGHENLFENSEEDLETQYKKTICRILEVDEYFAGELTLHDLRIYARGYNDGLFIQAWHVPDYLPNMVFQGPFSSPESTGGISQHFAIVVPWFRALAIARGDITDSEPPLINYIKGFRTYGDQNMDAALGVVDNPFGFCPAVDLFLPNNGLHHGR